VFTVTVGVFSLLYTLVEREPLILLSTFRKSGESVMRIMQRAILAIVGCLAISVVLLSAFTYPTYFREMKAAKTRLVTDSEVLATDRGNIEFAVRGAGPVVLVLHGAGGGYDQGLWSAKAVFGSGYKIIAVSRFGYLRSTLPSEVSFRAQARLYRDLLDYLHIQKVIVLGTSAGGPSAIQFANDYPDRTIALVLLSAVSQPTVRGDKPAVYISIIHAVQKSDYAYWLLAHFMQSSILSLMGVPPNIYAGFSDSEKELAQQMLDTMHPMSRRYRGTMNDGQMIQNETIATESLQAPTLILHALDDGLVSYQHAEHSHAAIRGSLLISFPTGGHGLLSRMQAVRLETDAFVRRIG
jgi:pimeloyl-ACP methyl ester carboxylesterase